MQSNRNNYCRRSFRNNLNLNPVMKAINILSIVFLISVSNSLFGQEQTATLSKVSVHDIYILPGFYSEQNTYGTIDDFRKLAPQSLLLKNDLSNYSQYEGSGMMTNGAFTAMVGLLFRNNDKTAYKANPLLRFGVSYFSATTLTNGLYNEERNITDTLTSSQTGQIIYLDSVKIKNFDMNYTSDQVRLTSSVICRTNPDMRWSLFGGAGASIGFSVKASTEIYYSDYRYRDAQYTNGSYTPYYYSESSTSKTERFNNKNNFNASVFIPMGVDFKIARKSEFWKRAHLYYEIQPGVNFTSIPELKTVSNISIQQGFGLRVNWE